MYSKVLLVVACLAVAAAQYYDGHGNNQGHAVSSQNIVHHSNHGYAQHTPLVAHHAPVIAHHAPAVSHHDSGVSHHAPVVSQHANDVSHHVPVVSHHAPAVSHHAPVVSYQAPAVSHHTPVVSHHAPAVSHYTPVIAHHTPVVSHHAPAQAPVVYHQPTHYGSHGEQNIEHHTPAHYAYEYNVNDPHTGDIKSQQETREGDAVQGFYSLHEADGTVRRVDYTVDKHSGFNAAVHREGEANHIAPAPQPNHNSYH